MVIELTHEQKNKLKKYIESFREYAKTEEFRKDIEDRGKREALFKAFTPEKLDSLTEYEFGNLISILWASGIWSNKEYLIQRIITQNGGLERIREGLRKLLFGKESISDRFDSFNVAGMGPAMITEILCSFNPNEYGIWNDKARTALKILGFDKTVPTQKYRISGDEYVKFNDLLKQISEELKQAGFKEADFLLVDYFLYEIAKTPKVREEKLVLVEPQEFDHDEAREKIGEIGSGLGFESDLEKAVAGGARVDVVWTANIGNLGIVRYVFEVHKAGSIDSLVLNLQKAKRNPTVQKVIAVSDGTSLEKIKKEVAGLNEEFRKSLVFWDVSEVYSVHQHLSEVVKSIEKLGLVEKVFEISPEPVQVFPPRKNEISEKKLLHVVKDWESKYGFVSWGAKEEAKYRNVFPDDKFEVVFLGKSVGKRKPDFKYRRIFITKPFGIPPGERLFLNSSEEKLIIEKA